MNRFWTAAAIIVAGILPVMAETVEVKYHGPVDLADYKCLDTVSSFVNRICFDNEHSQVVVLLNATYYAYCNVPVYVVGNWLSAESKGRFYNSTVKGSFACDAAP